MSQKHVSRRAAFTIVELIVAIAIIGILIFLSLPVITDSPGVDGQMTQTLSNMKQLHLATQQMDLDRQTTGDTNIGWPGDICSTFTNWTHQLVAGNYLSTNDLCKLLSARGKVVTPNTTPPLSESAVLAYVVRSNSPDSTLFLSSANFTNTPAGGAPLAPSAKPYGNKGFIVFRKGGDGAVLQARQVTNTEAIGDFAPLLR